MFREHDGRPRLFGRKRDQTRVTSVSLGGWLLFHRSSGTVGDKP